MSASLKDQVLETIRQLPPNVTMDEIIRRVRAVFMPECSSGQSESDGAAGLERSPDDPILGLGKNPVDAGPSDASVSLDRYLYDNL